VKAGPGRPCQLRDGALRDSRPACQETGSFSGPPPAPPTRRGPRRSAGAPGAGRRGLLVAPGAPKMDSRTVDTGSRGVISGTAPVMPRRAKAAGALEAPGGLGSFQRAAYLPSAQLMSSCRRASMQVSSSSDRSLKNLLCRKSVARRHFSFATWSAWSS